MDEQYLQRVMDGETEAFGYFVDNYKDMAFSLALGIIKNQPMAEDIVQESFIKAFRNIRKFKRNSKFSTWFYRIVVNEAIHAARKNRRKNLYFEERISGEEIKSNEQVNSLNHEEQKKYIDMALNKLSEKESLMLRLFYLTELSLQEIHEVTGYSIGNIKVILHRARNNFHDILKTELKSETKTIL